MDQHHWHALELIRNEVPNPTPDILNQNLHCNRMPRWCITHKGLESTDLGSSLPRSSRLLFYLCVLGRDEFVHHHTSYTFHKMTFGILVWELIWSECMYVTVYVRMCVSSFLETQWAQMGTTWDLQSNLPECGPWPQNWPAVWPWTNVLSSLNLCLLFCSVGMTSTLPGCYEDKNNVHKVHSLVPGT